MAIEFETLMLFFLYSLVVGAGIGVFYDAFRIVRIILPKAAFIIFIEDILFCLGAGVILCIFIFNAGFGIVRGYALAGAGLGFCAYYLTVGKIVYRLSSLIIAFIKKMLRFAARCAAAPFIAAAKGLLYLWRWVLRRIRQRILLRGALNAASAGFGLYTKAAVSAK